ncbi:MAG: AAA family ATPase [Bacteroidales bacterium]|jgi:cellulose biosynthesis protein BcsQ|nr:AAA family ATPase [Bacteroidales bacterium]
MKNTYQVVIIDVSPSFTGSLNKNILLSSDFFVTLCKPDLFSKQGLVNLREKMLKWKTERENIEMIVKRYDREIPFSHVITDRLTYLGYIINEYNVYAEKMITDHDKVVQEINAEL